MNFSVFAGLVYFFIGGATFFNSKDDIFLDRAYVQMLAMLGTKEAIAFTLIQSWLLRHQR